MRYVQSRSLPLVHSPLANEPKTTRLVSSDVYLPIALQSSSSSSRLRSTAVERAFTKMGKSRVCSLSSFAIDSIVTTKLTKTWFGETMLHLVCQQLEYSHQRYRQPAANNAVKAGAARCNAPAIHRTSFLYCSNAMRTSWLRVRTPVFEKSCCRVALTELSDTPIRSAISLFARPSKTQESTERSRSVNRPD